MFRKVLALTIALFLTVGAVFADEIKAVFKKYEDGKLTVTVEEKEKTFKVDKEAKVKQKTKDGEKEVTLDEILSNASKSKRGLKEGDKVTLTVEKETVTSVKREFGKPKDKTDK